MDPEFVAGDEAFHGAGVEQGDGMGDPEDVPHRVEAGMWFGIEGFTDVAGESAEFFGAAAET